VRATALTWALLTVVTLVNSQRSLAQNGPEWVGKRVITKFGAVVRAGDASLENATSGASRNLDHIYRVEQANGDSLSLRDEKTGAADQISAQSVVPYDHAVDYLTNEIQTNPTSRAAYSRRGALWREKKEYDKANADYDVAVRLQPGLTQAYFQRSVNQLIQHRNEAVTGFGAVLNLEGGKGRFSAYAVIFGHFSARRAADKATADGFLEFAAERLNVREWPYPSIKLLRGEIGEQAILAAATDNDRRTEARCYLGLDHELKGHNDQALAHFRWVRDHGNRDFLEYTISLAEIERLEHPDLKSPRRER
jgi:tetratricopeptide (TPR) repeat protein